MMVVTARLKKRNLLIAIAATIAILAVLLIPKNSRKDTTTSVKIETNEQRVAFLQELGWEVEQDPVQTQEIVIPTEDSDVYQRYNDLQKSQGYDLNACAGKVVKRCVYKVTNHPDTTGDYYATLLIHKGRVVGGDVASSAADGIMHALQRPAE